MEKREVPWYFREENTSTYESWYEGKYRRADLQEKALLKKTIEWIGNVESILEVGCGTAHFTRWFEENGAAAYGVDISPLMLREAKRLWERGKLVRATSGFLPVDQKTFDVVAFITCFEYMREPVEVVREAARVAQKGIVFGLMNSWSIPTMRRRIQLLLGRNPFYKTAHFYSLNEIKEVIEDAVGDGSYRTFQRSTVFPRPLPIRESRIPLGAFLSVGVKFTR